jgi:hypothetical protein
MQENFCRGVLQTGYQAKSRVFAAGGKMKKTLLLAGYCALALLVGSSLGCSYVRAQNSKKATTVYRLPPEYERGFDVEIVIDGQRAQEYAARGTTYIEALPGAEYEVRIRNHQPYRVAVALAVDGLNTIDARHTSAWNASKWVIEPYGTISIAGWQMSSERARRFYFTSEKDSYGAKLGQTANLGIISAVFFRERQPYPVTVTPRPRYDEDSRARSPKRDGSGESADKSAQAAPMRSEPTERDDEYAATGIGRSVHHDVRWVNMDLDSRSVGSVTLRYEYYPALVRLGILPRRPPYYPPDPLQRRESSRGFEDRRFSPEP